MMFRSRLVACLSLLLCSLPASFAERNFAPGCRLAPDDPLRAEVDRMMREGAAFEQQQRLALEQKVSQLGRARGWSQPEAQAYLRRVLTAGVDASWDQTLAVAAAFIQICEEQADGNQRADAVRLFREFYVVEARQWRGIHEQIDRELAKAEQDGPVH